jgi:hypothetical protein
LEDFQVIVKNKIQNGMDNEDDINDYVCSIIDELGYIALANIIRHRPTLLTLKSDYDDYDYLTAEIILKDVIRDELRDYGNMILEEIMENKDDE